MAVLMVYADLIEYGKQAVFCHVFGHKDVIVLRVGIGLLRALLCLPVLCYLWEVWGFSKQQKGEINTCSGQRCWVVSEVQKSKTHPD